MTYDEHLKVRIKVIEDTFEILDDHIDVFGKSLNINYFFFSDKADKIDSLGVELLKMGYYLEFETIKDENRRYVVTGHTDEMEISLKSIVEWIIIMCDLGLRFDC